MKNTGKIDVNEIEMIMHCEGKKNYLILKFFNPFLASSYGKKGGWEEIRDPKIWDLMEIVNEEYVYSVKSLEGKRIGIICNGLYLKKEIKLQRMKTIVSRFSDTDYILDLRVLLGEDSKLLQKLLQDDDNVPNQGT